jgi:sarcosine oxidase
MERADAIVIGGGAMGTACARSLGQRGLDTVLLEQFELGHRRGSSHGQTRIFRLAYPQPDYVRLARRALDAWRELEDAAGEQLLVATGGLYAGEWAEECGQALTVCGVPREWLPAEEAGERFPGIALDGIERVLYQEDGAVCLADRTVAAQARLARAAGVDIREVTEVVHIAVADDRITVGTDSGSVSAQAAVVAAGPWAGGLLSELAVELPLRPSFAQVSYFAPMPGGRVEALPTLIESDLLGGGLGSGGYLIPPVDGATELKAGDGTAGHTVDPMASPYAVDEERAAGDAAWVARRAHGFDPEPTRHDTCIYTMTPDEDFVIERVGRVVIGSACSGHGFKFTPLIGSVLADLVTGANPQIPEVRFSSRRAALTAG